MITKLFFTQRREDGNSLPFTGKWYPASPWSHRYRYSGSPAPSIVFCCQVGHQHHPLDLPHLHPLTMAAATKKSSEVRSISGPPSATTSTWQNALRVAHTGMYQNNSRLGAFLQKKVLQLFMVPPPLFLAYSKKVIYKGLSSVHHRFNASTANNLDIIPKNA